MATVESIIVIEAPVDAVYAIARNVEDFPKFMKDVEDVTILEDDGARTVSHWVGLIEEFNRTLEWTEEDQWDDEAHSCRFEIIEGDFTEYRGIWSFEEDEAGTLVKLIVEYEYAVPLIGPLIKKLLHRKVQQNCDNMLAAIKEQAEKD